MKKDLLIVVDMQNDFIDGALGTAEAQAIVPAVVDKIKNFNGDVLFTQDTHQPDYLHTQEGHNLPVPHCVEGTPGWQISPALTPYITQSPVKKATFGSSELALKLKQENDRDGIASITLIGLCTDICVISNAMTLKAFMPEVPIKVEAACCAGVTPESHTRALEAMKVCQIDIV